jgi:hypothetical protein
MVSLIGHQKKSVSRDQRDRDMRANHVFFRSFHRL